MAEALEDPQAVHEYFVNELWPLARDYQASDKSLQHAYDANGVVVVGFSGVGKEFNNEKCAEYAASQGREIVQGEQETTRPPRTTAEANGKSAYTHRDLRDPNVRETIRRKLAERDYFQAYVWFSTEFMTDPRPGDPGEPTHLYMTDADTFSLAPDSTTLVEYVFEEADAFLKQGLLKRGIGMFATTPYRWLDRYYSREDRWPANHSTRLIQAISSGTLTRAAVQKEMPVPADQKNWILTLNDYLDGNGDIRPAFMQMYDAIYGEVDTEMHEASYEEGGVLIGFIELLRSWDITLDEARRMASLRPEDGTEFAQELSGPEHNRRLFTNT